MERWPQSVAVRYIDSKERESSSCTYEQLYKLMGSVQQQLLQHHKAVSVTDTTKGCGGFILMFEPGLNFFVAFLACIASSIPAIPVFPINPGNKTAVARLNKIMEVSGTQTIITDTSLHRKLRFTSWGRSAKLVVIKPTTAYEGKLKDLATNPAALCFVQFTSGSTSDPKGVMLSHHNVVWDTLAMAYYNEERRRTDATQRMKLLSWCPQYHDMGLMSALQFMVGLEVTIMSPVTFLQNPPIWMNMCNKYKPDVLSCPTFSLTLVARKWNKPLTDTSIDLSSVGTMIIGAEPVTTTAIDTFLGVFGHYGFPPTAINPSFGMAEAVVGVCMKTPQPRPRKAIHNVDTMEMERTGVVTILQDAEGKATATFVSNGLGLVAPPGNSDQRDVEMVIVDTSKEDDAIFTPLPPMRTGELWVHSPSVGMGYMGLVEYTQKQFRAQLSGGSGGDKKSYLRTGDQAFLDDDGELYICGRLKDMIILHGRNIFPNDIETTVLEMAHKDIRPGCCGVVSVNEGGQEKVIVVTEVRNGNIGLEAQRKLMKDIQHTVQMDHNCSCTVLLLHPKTIPKTTSGKVRRHQIKVDYVAGNLKVLEGSQSGGPSSGGTGDDFQWTYPRLSPLQFRLLLGIIPPPPSPVLPSAVLPTASSQSGGDFLDLPQTNDVLPRQSTSTMFVEGESSELIQTFFNELYPLLIEAQIKYILYDLVGDPTLGPLAFHPSVEMLSFGMDSLQLTQLSGDLMKHFGEQCDIEVSTVSGCNTIADLCSVVQQRVLKLLHNNLWGDVNCVWEPITLSNATPTDSSLVLETLIGVMYCRTMTDDNDKPAPLNPLYEFPPNYIHLKLSDEFVFLLKYLVCNSVHVSLPPLEEDSNGPPGMHLLNRMCAKIQADLSSRAPDTLLLGSGAVSTQDVDVEVLPGVDTGFRREPVQVVKEGEEEEQPQTSSSVPTDGVEGCEQAVLNFNMSEESSLKVITELVKAVLLSIKPHETSSILYGTWHSMWDEGTTSTNSRITVGATSAMLPTGLAADATAAASTTGGKMDRNSILKVFIIIFGILITGIFFTLSFLPCHLFWIYAVGQPFNFEYLVPDRTDDNGTQNERSFTDILLYSGYHQPVSIVLVIAGFALSTVLAKFAIITLTGGIAPGHYARHSRTWYKWWLFSVVWRTMSLPLNIMGNTPFGKILNFLLGAKWGTAGSIPGIHPWPERLIIQPGSDIAGNSTLITDFVDQRQHLVFGDIHIGSGCIVSDYTCIMPDVIVNDGVYLGIGSVVNSHTNLESKTQWSGNPLKQMYPEVPHLFVVSSPTPGAFAFHPTVLDIIKVLWMVISPALLGLAMCWWQLIVPKIYAPPHYEAVGLGKYFGTLTPLVVLFLTVCVGLLQFMVIIVLLKWLLIGKVKPGGHSKRSWYTLRCWMVDWMAGPINGRLLTNVASFLNNWWLKCLGADMKAYCVIPHGLSGISPSTADLFHVGRKVFGAARMRFVGVVWNGETKQYERRPILLADNCCVGFKAIIVGGCKVHRRARIGCLAVVDKDVPEGVTAMGNPVPQLTPSPMGRSEVQHQHQHQPHQQPEQEHPHHEKQQQKQQHSQEQQQQQNPQSHPQPEPQHQHQQQHQPQHQQQHQQPQAAQQRRHETPEGGPFAASGMGLFILPGLIALIRMGVTLAMLIAPYYFIAYVSRRWDDNYGLVSITVIFMFYPIQCFVLMVLSSRLFADRWHKTLKSTHHEDILAWHQETELTLKASQCTYFRHQIHTSVMSVCAPKLQDLLLGTEGAVLVFKAIGGHIAWDVVLMMGIESDNANYVNMASGCVLYHWSIHEYGFSKDGKDMVIIRKPLFLSAGCWVAPEATVHSVVCGKWTAILPASHPSRATILPAMTALEGAPCKPIFPNPYDCKEFQLPAHRQPPRSKASTPKKPSQGNPIAKSSSIHQMSKTTTPRNPPPTLLARRSALKHSTTEQTDEHSAAHHSDELIKPLSLSSPAEWKLAFEDQNARDEVVSQSLTSVSFDTPSHASSWRESIRSFASTPMQGGRQLASKMLTPKASSFRKLGEDEDEKEVPDRAAVADV